MSKADDLFFKQFGALLAFLVVFALVVFLLARGIGSTSFKRSQQTPKAVAARIAPVGQVRLAGDAGSQPVAGATEQAVAPAAPATETAAGTSGEAVYNKSCAACHATGVAGAPKVDDKAAWEPRFAQGMDTLMSSVLKGKGAMPAKGGSTDLSDDEVKSAVEFMLQTAGLVEAATSTAPAAPAEAKTPAPAKTPAQEATPPAQTTAPAPAKAPAQTAAAPAPAKETTAAAGPGGEAVYNKSCAACHSTGVAGAPKTDDKAAWEPRMAQGMDALIGSALKGKGAMPAKGGNTSLSDAEVKSAVEFMLQKAGLAEAATSTAPAAPAEAKTPAPAKTPAQEATPPAQTTAPAQTKTPTQTAAAPAPATESTAAAGPGGEAVYNKSCAACHSTGAAGAPKVGDETAWEPRIAQGIDTLVNSVLKGKGAMPAKGGNAELSDTEIKSAIEFMLAGAKPAVSAAAGKSSSTETPGDQVYMSGCVACHASGVNGAPKLADRAAWESLEAKGIEALARSVVDGKGSMPAGGGNASLSENEIRGAVEFMLDAAKFSVPAIPTFNPETAAAAVAQPATDAAGQIGAAVYNKSCAACHATGAAGAPKVGDTAAWKPRIAQGLDTMVSSALKGKGAMPAKGGNTALSDDDVRNAVQFMLKQSGGSG